MIPNNVVTRSAIRDSYTNYDVTEYNPLVYKVRGGLDIRDTDLGMDVAGDRSTVRTLPGG
jgi:hypothetical protein